MKTIIYFIIASIIGFFAHREGSNHGNKYCAKLKDGRLIVVHEGAPLASEITLANGTKIKPDGTVLYTDGSKMLMQDGECIDKNGKMLEQKSKPEESENEKNKKTP